MSSAELHDALFKAIREDDRQTVLKIKGDHDEVDFEAHLSKALHTLHVLRIPLSEETRIKVFEELICLRYKLSSGTDATPKTDTWQWVDMLLRYSGDLDGKLQRCVEVDDVEVDDECVLLATISALALRAVKRSFKATYVWLPWEEMEFLLVSFAASHSKFQPEVKCVTNAERTRRHLKIFRTLVERLKIWYRKATDGKFKSLGKTLNELLRKEYLLKPAKHLRDQDQDLDQDIADIKCIVDFYADCAVLRDWRSLQDVREALQVATKALDPENNHLWEPFGRLALPMALVQLGERLKNTWESPHLSTHYASRMELILGAALTKKLSNIRDDLLHVEIYYQQLESMRQLTDKPLLLEDVKQASAAVGALLIEAGAALEVYAGDDINARSRIEEILKRNEHGECMTMTWQNIILGKLETLTESIHDKDKKNKFKTFLLDLKEACSDSRFVGGVGKKKIQLQNRSAQFSRLNLFSDSMFIVSSCGLYGLQVGYAFNLVRSVIFGSKFTRIQNCIKRKAEKNQESSPQTNANKNMNDLMVALGQTWQGRRISTDFDWYTVKSALLARVTLCEQSGPCVDLAGPVLFGGRLRNYIAHQDLLVRECLNPKEELGMLLRLTTNGSIDLQRGAQPRMRSADAAQEEFDRLLELVRAKCDIVNCALRGYLYALEAMVKAYTNLYYKVRDCSGRTLLHAAAQGGHKDSVKWLLDQGVDPQAVDCMGRTALHVAASKEVADLLMGKITVDLPDRAGFSPLHCAAMNGRAEVVRMLLEKGAADTLLLESSSGHTALDVATLSGKDEAVKVLLDKGAAVRERTLLHAAKFGRATCMGWLLRSFEPSKRLRREALQHAAAHGHRDVIIELLKSVYSFQWDRDAGEGSSSTVVSRNRTLWHRYGRFDKVDVDEALLDKLREALANIWHAEDRSSLLHWAAESGSMNTVGFLISIQGTVLQRKDDGRTPLHCAAAFGHRGVVRILMNSTNHDHLQEDKVCPSPLHEAAANGHVGVVEELVVGHHWAVNELDGDGRTALHHAALMGQESVLRRLLKLGADRRNSKSDGGRAIHMAVQGGHIGAVRVLLEEERCSKQELMELLHSKDLRGWNVLHIAAYTDNATIAENLLDREKELMEDPELKDAPLVSRRDKSGCTCLQVAVQCSCSSKTIEVFMDGLWAWALKSKESAKVEVVELINEAFAEAVKEDNLSIAESIHSWDRQRGCGRPEPMIFKEVKLPTEGIGVTHLRRAVQAKSSSDMVRLLLDCMWQSKRMKPPLSDKDKFGMIEEALFLAVSEDCVSIARCILKWNLRTWKKRRLGMPLVFRENKDGKTLLKIVTVAGSKDMMKTLKSEECGMRNKFFIERFWPIAKHVWFGQTVACTSRAVQHVSACREVAELPIHEDVPDADWDGRARVVLLLLEKGVAETPPLEEESNSGNGIAALDVAVLLGEHKTVEKLLGKEPTVRNHTLLYAAKSGSVECVQLLLLKWTSPPESLLTQALQHAAAHGDLNVVHLLLQSVQERCDAARGALRYAARNGRVDVLEALLEECPVADTWRDEDGCSLLHLAARSRSKDTVSFLVEKAPGTVLHCDKRDWSPLHHAAAFGHKEVVHILLDKTPNDNPLHLAAMGGHVDVVEELVVVNRWAVDARGLAGGTALHYAALAGQDKVVGLLLKRGANRHLAEKAGFTALQLAVRGGHIDVVRVLLKPIGQKCSEPELLELLCSEDSDGQNALQHAACTDNSTIAKELLDREKELSKDIEDYAVLALRRDKMDSCLQWAVQHNSPDMMWLLLECMWESNRKKLPCSDADTLAKIGELLFLAASQNYVDFARCILQWELQLDIPPLEWNERQLGLPLGFRINRDGESLLTIATKGGSEDMMEILKSEECGMQNKIFMDRFWITAKEVWFGQTEHCTCRTAQPVLAIGEDAELPNEETAEYLTGAVGHCPLHSAAWDRRAEVVLFLLEKGVAETLPLQLESNAGNTALDVAVLLGEDELVKVLLEKGEAVTGSSLLYAAKFNKLGCLDMLLKIPRPPEAPPLKEALQQAAAQGHLKVVLQLLRSFPSDQKREAARGALYYATRNGHLKVLKALLKECPQADTLRHEKGGSYLLHVAARYEKDDMVRFLVGQASGTVLLCDWLGFTPLHWAAAFGHLGIVRILLAKIPDKYHLWKMLSPLHLAAMKGHVVVVEELVVVNRWAVDGMDLAGGTALHYAALTGQAEVVRLLLKRGANRHLAEKAGFTALHLAVLGGHIDVVRAFLEPTTENCSERELLEMLCRTHSKKRVVLHSSTIADRASERSEVIKDLAPLAFGRDDSGHTCLQWPVQYSWSPVVVNLLLESMWQSKRNPVGTGSMSPKRPLISRQDKLASIEELLFLAASQNCVDFARCILEWELNLDIPPPEWKERQLGLPLVFRINKDGESLLTIATKGGFEDMMEMLESEECGMQNKIFRERRGL